MKTYFKTKTEEKIFRFLLSFYIILWFLSFLIYFYDFELFVLVNLFLLFVILIGSFQQIQNGFYKLIMENK